MAVLPETIRSIPIFSGLSREDIAKVLGKMEECSFSVGMTIVSQGDKGDAFYVIQSGAVQVVLESVGGRSEAIALLGPQDYFGEMALLSGEPRSATIITVKETNVWRLSREAWDELIDRHPTWLLQLCATLSKRLSRADQQYSIGRDAFNSLAEELYNSKSPEQQKFFRRAALLSEIDTNTVGTLLQTEGAKQFLEELETSNFPLIRHLEGERYELHLFFRDFLREKLLAVEGKEVSQQLHAQIAAQYEALGDWQQAIHHFKEIQDWPAVTRLLVAQKEELLNGAAVFVKNVFENIPQEHFFADSQLVHIKAMILAHLGDLVGAFRTYKEVLSQKAQGSLGTEGISRYLTMADTLRNRGEYAQAINCLRSALNLAEQETANWDASPAEVYRTDNQRSSEAALPVSGARVRSRFLDRLRPSAGFLRASSRSRWLGAILGLGIGSYLWFGTPDLGLDRGATRLLGLLSFTLIYWVFRVLPDYGVALIFALGLILTRLATPQTVMGGFASTTWFMTLGVLGLGAAITGSGLFYRLSLHLVRMFPLNYYWQIFATGLMGVVVMALIPQQTARTAITSQMLVNLSESLGYKTPSKASTGLFAASFLGLGQLGFLFLTGSTTSLIAWGLLPRDVRLQFTWGYWFIAALPPTLVVIAIVLFCIIFLYRPESEPKISYKMVQTQLDVLGALSFKEWISFSALCLTVAGWLTVPYHGIDSAWIALIAFAILVNTAVLDWGTMRKAIDWELLIYMGVTLSIPELLTRAKLDQWLVELISPVIDPVLHNPAL
ncbi:MAG TPA: SLC13 family permease, partial [Candidatus Binatia bacterium]|nr:SLC13 family permease [Candidatus Binatia bacterium]